MADLSRFNYKKLSLEDRQRLREVRKKIRLLWFPPMEQEIRTWRRKTGINSSIGIKEFSELNRNEKERFFSDAEVFVRLVENASKRWYRKQFPRSPDSLENAFVLLGLQNKSPFYQVQKRYRQLVLKYHPDKGGNPETFVQISNAYRTICNHL